MGGGGGGLLSAFSGCLFWFRAYGGLGGLVS